MDGTKLWAQQLLEKKITRQVFLSSISSVKSGSSDYGRAKLELGDWFVSNGLTSINLGLVIGQGGMFQRVLKIFEFSPIIPLIDGGLENIYFLGLDELVQFILEYCNSDLGLRLNSPIMFFQPNSVTMKQLFETLSLIMKKDRYYISIGSKPIYNILALWEKFVRLKLPINKNNLEGLKQNENLIITSDYIKYGLQNRSLDEILRKNIPIA